MDVGAAVKCCRCGSQLHVCGQRLNAAVVVEGTIEQDIGTPFGFFAQIGEEFVFANIRLFSSRGLGQQQTAVFLSWKPLDYMIAVPGETRQFLGKKKGGMAFPTPCFRLGRRSLKTVYIGSNLCFKGHVDIFYRTAYVQRSESGSACDMCSRFGDLVWLFPTGTSASPEM